MRRISLLLTAVGGLLVLLVLPALLATTDGLPDYCTLELLRLEETWNILDQVAARIWPGWTNYPDVPFHFEYPNGVKMLVGHPSPMDGYDLIPGVEIRGKKVYLNKREEIPLAMKPPMSGGGGILSLGKDQVVTSVDLKMSPVSDKPAEAAEDPAGVTPLPPELRISSDKQILINIHELFHCYQRPIFRYRYGNLRFNPDAAYALYSEVEGLALEKAFLETDPEKSRELIKDFLAARELKQKSMNDEEKHQEAEDDVGEGTAVYSEIKSLELMKSGYKPGPAKGGDPWYFGFKDTDAFLAERLTMLRSATTNTLEAKMKCYPYGAFQAVLLTRHFPGWQEGFFEKNPDLAEALRTRLKPSAEEMKNAVQRLASRYPVEEIARRTGDLIGKRDAALKTILKREGRSYVVNFKPTAEYPAAKGRGETFHIGLVHLFPEGIEEIEIREAVLTGLESPMIVDQIYYVKWIDTETKPGEKGYTVAGNDLGGGIYTDAVFSTKGFTLKAPKIQVKETPGRVKITVLEKISGRKEP